LYLPGRDVKIFDDVPDTIEAVRGGFHQERVIAFQGINTIHTLGKLLLVAAVLAVLAAVEAVAPAAKLTSPAAKLTSPAAVEAATAGELLRLVRGISRAVRFVGRPIG